jgi:8-oxo-dGTP pyrophosphatase MutT (NUDIX family)
MSHSSRDVVVVLPFNTIDNSVLMQLRDDKPGIDAPGLWGFFGGGINKNETSRDCAIRELEEEISYQTTDIYHLNSEIITDLNYISAHAYTTQLIDPLSSLFLREGRDFKNVTVNEVLSGEIYSNKFKYFFPIVNTYYIKKCFTEAINFWSTNRINE